MANEIAGEEPDEPSRAVEPSDAVESSDPEELRAADGGDLDEPGDGETDAADASAAAVGRIEKWRVRAERARARGEDAADRYQQRAVEQPVLGLPLVFLSRYTARQGMLLASAVAFRLFLWLLPLSLLTAGILAGIAAHRQNDVESAARHAGLTGAASQQAITAIQGGGRSWWVAVVIGLVLLIWTTRTLIRNLVVVNAHIWSTPLRKRKQKEQLITVIYFIVGWIVVFVGIIGVAKAKDYIPGGFVVVGLVQACVLGGAWLLVTSQLPDRRSSWKALLPGCVLFGVAFAALHAISRVYLPNKIHSASELYGSLGIAGTMLAWLLIIGQVIVFASLANVVWADFLDERQGQPVMARRTGDGIPAAGTSDDDESEFEPAEGEAPPGAAAPPHPPLPSLLHSQAPGNEVEPRL
ncbi:Uncharacterized membrane protein, BrkB/YihY/UPF0761 family (not an RNase) [Frankineae bacterium MT45]|nr:Uncharacterized membrane protein, BrkB/YihY/UPF0761 family (not an RNase) [Frankineae bacterium MT45]